MDKNKAGKRLHQCDSVQMNPEAVAAAAGRHQQEVCSTGRMRLERRYDCMCWLNLFLHWIYLYLKTTCLKIEIHEIHKIYEIHMPKY